MQKQYPFKFLDSYGREDRDFFFGRDAEIEELYNMTFQAKIMLIYGTSGTGKTSLIQCGLANKFQDYDWAPVFIRRENNIIRSLDKCLCEESDEAFVYSKSDGKTIKDLYAKIDAVYKAFFKPIYLIFDQFEELYILGDAEEQANFTDVIRQLMGINQKVKIIISIREEYLGYLYAFEKMVPELIRKKLRIESMNRLKVREVIVGIGSNPHSLVTLKKGEENQISDTIFEKLLEDKHSHTIQLPYLQVFLDNLYMHVTKEKHPPSGEETRKAEAIFSMDALNGIGNIGDVLRSFLVEQVSKTALTFQKPEETIWRILSPFVTLQGTKNPIEKSEVFTSLKDIPGDLIEQVIEVFKNKRILRLNENNQRYEITHDALAKQVNANRSPEEIAILQVKRMIKNLVEAQKGKSRVFDEEQLAIIKQFRERILLEPEEEKAIESSQQIIDEEKRQEEEQKKIELEKARKRNRTLAGLLMIALMACIGVGFLWNYANQKKIEAVNTNIKLTKSQDSTIEALRKADSLKQVANQSEKDAQNNLLQVFESEKSRYTREIQILKKNIQSYEQYGAGNDVIDDENRKIKSLNEKIKDLEQKMENIRK